MSKVWVVFLTASLLNGMVYAAGVPNKGTTAITPAAREDCLGELCLGDRLTDKPNISWVDIEQLSLESKESRSGVFPSYNKNGTPSKQLIRDLILPQLPLDATAEQMSQHVSMTSEILKRSKEAFVSSIQGTKIVMKDFVLEEPYGMPSISPKFIRLLLERKAVVCETEGLLAGYFSKSGHPTTAAFSPSSPEEGHAYVILALKRRYVLPMESRSRFVK
jgi:hypothetical protein